MVAVLQWSFFSTLVRHGTDKIHSVGYCILRRIEVQSRHSTIKLFRSWQTEDQLCALGRSKITQCVHESLVAVHQPLYMYFHTELFVTGNREGGPLSRVRNCGNLTTKFKIHFRSQYQKNEVQIQGKRKVAETQNPLSYGHFAGTTQKVGKFAKNVKSGLVHSKFHLTAGTERIQFSVQYLIEFCKILLIVYYI
jgi:hypothetical protein